MYQSVQVGDSYNNKTREGYDFSIVFGMNEDIGNSIEEVANHSYPN